MVYVGLGGVCGCNVGGLEGMLLCCGVVRLGCKDASLKWNGLDLDTIALWLCGGTVL